MNKICFFCFLFIVSGAIFSQSAEGYWDTMRITATNITLVPRERIFIKTDNFPTGTTEVVYRITVLNDNQKLSNSLFSVLKSIPDPSGISQGSAGAVLLLSTVSGDEKCKYGIYTSENTVKQYVETGKTDAACYFQNNAITKEAKLISKNSKCIIDTSSNLYFAFTNDNWVMQQKIVLEVVPWINKKASRGWNLKTKQEVLAILKRQTVYKNSSKKEIFSGLFLENLTQKQSYADFKLLLDVEKNILIQNTVNLVLVQSGEIKLITNQLRKQAATYFTNSNYEDAITIIKEQIIDSGLATTNDYIDLGRFYLFSRQFEKAFQSLKKAEDLDSAQLKTQLNLAHVYLFTDKVGDAKLLHKKYKLQNITATKSWIAQTNEDLKIFEEKGFSTENFKKIKAIITN